ncbi:MAG: UvrD-helicase domain-containing protein [Pseudomonadota bacterium]
MTLLQDDAHARRRALDIEHSFCVQAPAGSGKTELLTQRILCLLAHAEKPEEILAFTFTRKAAAEMRNRLLTYLQNAAVTSPEQIASLPDHKRLTLQLAQAVLQRDAQQNWDLLANSKRLRINTIDSFNSHLTALLPLSSSFGSRPQISTDMEQVFATAIQETLAHLERPGQLSNSLAVLLQHLHNNLYGAAELLHNLLNKRDQWLPLVAQLRVDPLRARSLLEQNLADMITATLETAACTLQAHEAEILALINYAATNLEAMNDARLSQYNFQHELPPANSAHVAEWRALASFFLLKDGKDLRKSVRVTEGFPGQEKTFTAAQKAHAAAMKQLFAETCGALSSAGFLSLLQLLARLPDPTYTPEQWQVMAALTDILPLLAAQLDVAMREAGRIDHTQTSLAALQALGTDIEPTDFALRLDYHIRHILVDEFQDTSSMQFHLIEKLTNGWTTGDGRTLFIVGDGMQSCYAFRDAKVGLFLRARDEGIGSVTLEPLQLGINFRSDSKVVDWVNLVFSGAFPQIDDIDRGGVHYSPSQARADVAEADAGVTAQFWIADENTDTESKRDVEAEAVATLCSRLQSEDPQQSIAILVRGRSHLNAIVPALRAHGLRWNASEIDSLLSYGAVNDIFILLQALLNRADGTAWFALLRTPFVGLCIADIETLALYANSNEYSLWTALQQHASLTALSDDGRSRLARCVPILQHTYDLRQQLPLRILLENTWIALGGPATLHETSVLPNIVTFLTLVEQHEVQGDLPDIHNFRKQLARCYGSAVDAAVNLHIMTIHKAKGLEFDVVILPGLDRSPPAPDSPLLIWKEFLDTDNEPRPLLGLLPSKGADTDPVYQYLRLEAGMRIELETTRLLYIGVTRAIRQAWLFGNVKVGKDGPAAPSRSLLQTIFPQLLQHQEKLNVIFSAVPAALPSVREDDLAKSHNQPIFRLPSTWQSPLSASLLPPILEVEVVELDEDQPLAAKVGELIHLGLKNLVERGSSWLKASVTAPLWQRELLSLCSSKEQLQEAISLVLEQLHKCVDAPEAAWLFNTPHTYDRCELALSDFSTGFRRDFVIDRTFVDAKGERWIIDYKSARPQSGQSLETFCNEQSALYRPQLENYRRLLAEPAQPVRLALFFTAIAHLHLLD